MATVVQAPLEMVEAVASLRLPPKADQHLQKLMDRNTNGVLAPGEREDLEMLVELSETLALVRPQALHLLVSGGSQNHGSANPRPISRREYKSQ